jgi:methylase of polypeptide subunit release factors
MAGRNFAHSTPELYSRCMGPLWFEPFAKIVAQHAAAVLPDRILETAAGIGIVTRAVHLAVPNAQLVATDINPAMLEFAAATLLGPAAQAVAEAFQPWDGKDMPISAHLILARKPVVVA